MRNKLQTALHITYGNIFTYLMIAFTAPVGTQMQSQKEREKEILFGRARVTG